MCQHTLKEPNNLELKNSFKNKRNNLKKFTKQAYIRRKIKDSMIPEVYGMQ